jgi:acetyl/propionyl-CoA carboxylase alpha subunit
LIANRGETALRIIRACRELGVSSVAIYSDADVHAPHVREADEAVHLGPAPSSESYLRGDLIVEAARRVGAEAVHPGYGFLSEREWFARLVIERAGLGGAAAEAIAAMGARRRREARHRRGTLVPGTTEPLKDLRDARDTATRFGFGTSQAAAGGRGKVRVGLTANWKVAGRCSTRSESRVR